MKRINIIERKIKTAKDLHSIVKTMKGLAAVSIGQYENAVDAISSYYLTIERGLQVILLNEPQMTSFFQSRISKESRKRIAVIFGAGQPMCGAFNEVLANYFDKQWRSASEEGNKIVTIGNRIMTNLEHYNRETDHYFEMPSTIERINDVVQALVVSIQKWYSDEGYSEVYLYYNRPEGNTSYIPVTRQLFPINVSWLQELSKKSWEGASLPTFTMDVVTLFSGLIKQLLFVTVYKAFAESLSAENNSRLSAMQLAEKKINEMIDDLTNAYRNQRQVNITEEILDIMASFEMLRSEGEDF